MLTPAEELESNLRNNWTLLSEKTARGNAIEGTVDKINKTIHFVGFKAGVNMNRTEI